MKTALNDPAQHSQTIAETEWVVFKTSPIHGTGGFARVDIPEGTQVIEYVGRKITKRESQRLCEENNVYVFALDDEYDLDGSVEFNLARFVNHSCDPNCEALDDEGRIWLTAARDIKAGEEITFNYGYDLEDYREHPCRCGAPGCVGFIVSEEYFDQIRRARNS